jgi:dolichol-phosphate mannosyltransferase
MKLSVVIPAYNEAESLPETVRIIYQELRKQGIEHEIVVVNDNSKDGTLQVLEELNKTVPTLAIHTNPGPNGFGMAVRYGLERFTGDCVAVMMADLSDSPGDLVLFYRKMQEGYDCVFGSRFIKGAAIYDYPGFKLYVNRFVNTIVRLSFGLKYNDLTNAFKMYRKETMQGLKPFLSHHFNLTLELPLKAIIRGYTYAVIPNSWTNRKHGESKLKLKEMGSRYFFIYVYCLIEKYFSSGDYKKN